MPIATSTLFRLHFTLETSLFARVDKVTRMQIPFLFLSLNGLHYAKKIEEYSWKISNAVATVTQMTDNAIVPLILTLILVLAQNDLFSDFSNQSSSVSSPR